ncbi:cupin domain-containing protein [Luedemannella flava]|uniref:Cupin domain-containing protein n=1 Tax=Luedemannella flava TaxID=349316 RepID=A0ABN2MGD0_9ACTN
MSGDVRVVRAGAEYAGRQGLTMFVGVSAETVGAIGLCLHRLVVPPGGRARAHVHAGHESAIYVLAGDVDVRWGEALEHTSSVSAGDFMYIPPGVPHAPINHSATDPAYALVARTDPNEQESVVLRPDLDDLLLT